MKKKIAVFAVSFAILSCIFSIMVSAETGDVMALLPTNDFEEVYVLLDENQRQFPIYGIRENISQYTDLSEWLPSDHVGLVEWIRGLNAVAGTTINLNLYDGTILSCTLTNDFAYSCTMTLINLSSGLTKQYTLFAGMAVDVEYLLVVQNDGYLGFMRYNKNTGEQLSSGTLVYPMYGNVYIPDRIPDSSAIDQAYQDGFTDGFESGYAEGIKDGSLATYDEVVVYNRGYQDGYEKGVDDGFIIAISSDGKAIYDKGVSDGQEQAQIIPKAIDGFFESMLKFFTPFLSIGVGNLTLYSMLGVLLVVGIVVVIIKITR